MRTDLKTVDLRLAVVDEPPPSEPVYIKCLNPNHSEKTASCAVFPDHIHCFGCGFHVSYRMESLAALLGVPLRRAFSEAHKYTNAGLDAYRERTNQPAKREPLPSSIAEGYAGLLHGPRKNRLQWYVDRGIPVEWVKQMSLGHTGEKFSIPVFDAQGNLINVRFRRDDLYAIEPEPDERPNPKYSGMRGRNGTYFYPEQLFFSGTRAEVFVLEGELDALRVWTQDYEAISPTNGAQSVKHCATFLKQFPRVKTVYLATDQDGPGEEAAKDFLQSAQGTGWTIYRMRWDGGKDVSELPSFDPELWFHDPRTECWMKEGRLEERMSIC